MQIVETIQEIERQFWTKDAQFYEQHLAPEAVMVFPHPVGVLPREAILNSIKGQSRWTAVHMKTPHCWQLSEDVILLSYEASATRSSETNPYNAWITSLYLRSDNDWKLAFHQHSPAPPE